MDDENQLAPRVPAYERSEAKVRPIVILGLGLLAMTLFVLLLMGWLQASLESRQARLAELPSPFEETRQLPPEPRLQVAPGQDLQQLRATEETALKSYGWIDRSAGIVRIPVERAMELLAERGLPSRPAVEDRGSRVEDRGSKIEDRGSKIDKRGSRP